VLILGFVGIKILIAEVAPVTDFASLAIIALLLAGGISASLLADHFDRPQQAEAAARRPPRCPPELVPMQSANGRSKTQRSRS
jgi:uncharacterized membrane protein YdcZ (DUF606 family)